MPEPKRQCQTCRYFQAAQLAGNGWCTHPTRQMESDVKILVRERELACRNAWGDDLWADPSLPATTSPPPSSRPSPTYVGHRLDDEVTSVIDASVHSHGTAQPDDVVTFTAVRAGERPTRPANDVNSEAVADQEERARVMARGNRDAILSARKRHALRRSSTPNAPTATDTDEATVLESIATVDAGELASEDATSTREDVQPAAAEPAFAPATVRSSVGLPRLRSFLRGESDEPAVTESVPAFVRPSHFEHVMLQAERIKERAAAHQILGSDAKSAKEPFEPQGFNEEPVISNVDPETLDVAFARIRTVLDQPPLLVADSTPELPASDQDFVLIEASPRAALYQPNPTSVEQEMGASIPEEEPEEYVEAADLDHAVNETMAYSASDPQDIEEDALESPRSSLWRSFNQRLRRRFKVQADSEPIAGYDEPFLEDDAPFHHEEHLESSDGLVASAFHSNDPDTWYDPEQPTQMLVTSDGIRDTVDDGLVDDSFGLDGEDVWTATTEESWRLDEREFPEPQPAEWHRTRRELLSSLPPVESLDDSVQFIAPTPQATPVAPVAPRRPLPDPRDFFDISDPSGLAAFRVALFGSSSRPIGASISDLYRESTHADPGPPKQDERYFYSPEVDEYPSHGRDDGDWASTNDDELQRFDSHTSLERLPLVDKHYLPPRTSRRDIELEEAPQRRAQSVAPIAAPVDAGKCCATCRSFLPDEDGTRGRCTNEWASRHRSVVEANELACRSSFGDWWIAADSTWIPSDGESAREGTASSPRASRVRTSNLD